MTFKTKYRNTATYLAVACLTLMVLFSCSPSDNGSVTDVMTVSRSNAFITRDDIANGLVKTLNSLPKVILSHQVHGDAGVSCQKCHHSKYNDERIKTCAYCHKGIEGAEKIHEACIGCHRKENRGPQTCDTCHKGKGSQVPVSEFTKLYSAKEVYKNIDVHGPHSENNIDCKVCHHKHGEHKSEEAQEKCSDCHTGVSKMKILHSFCKACHISKNRGPVSCKGCHKNSPEVEVDDIIVLPDTGHRKPRISFTHKAHVEKYNTECIDCHHKGTNKSCSAEGCHKMKDQGAIINLKGAFHQQCHDCHRRTKGPQACGRCHVSGKR